MSPAARASHGNVMQITTGTRWARTGNVSASRRARAAEAAPGKAARVEPAARHDSFQDYYAVKSHLAAPRGGVREHVRSEVKSRGAMREGRACRGRTHAALGAGLPDVPRRGRAAGDVGPYHRSQSRSRRDLGDERDFPSERSEVKSRGGPTRTSRANLEKQSRTPC